MKTIYNGREFAVEAVNADDKNEFIISGYKLTGKRGAEYYLIRSSSNPAFLFPVKFDGRMGTLKGWFKEVASMQLQQI